MGTRKKPTLIIERRATTQPKAALACVILEASFARSTASIASFNEKRVPFRPFGRRGSVAMVEMQGRRKKMAWHTGYKDKPEP